jgi:hypothetical protein
MISHRNIVANIKQQFIAEGEMLIESHTIDMIERQKCQDPITLSIRTTIPAQHFTLGSCEGCGFLGLFFWDHGCAEGCHDIASEYRCKYQVRASAQLKAIP